MDGSYGNVFPSNRTIPAGAPAPSNNTNSQYKINVNRQKTRKWANFKPQNYDGDDWGGEDDDDDDETAEYEPEPVPPPKPLGPRHPGAYSPSAAGRPFPSATSPPPRNFPPTPSGTASVPRRSTEPPQHPSIATLPPDGRRVSPGPQSAHPLPSQRPQGSFDTMRQPGSSIRPVDAPKPWTDARSASPQNARSPPSSNKPLPFVRPSDVYRRLEAEKEKERRSLEGVRPGADAGPSQVPEPTAPVPRQQEAPDPRPVDTLATAGAGSGLGLGLPPIAERKSEYGIEGLLDSYGTEEPAGEPAAAEGVLKSGESQKSVQPVSHEELRRYSRSPQLPDLSRMSGFGVDLFSSSLFSTPELRSPVSGSMQLAASDPPSRSSPTVAARESTASNPAPGTVLDADAKTPQHGAGVGPGSNQDQPVGLGLHGDRLAAEQPTRDIPEQQAAAAEAPREPAVSTVDQLAPPATRPSLPGAWVSETPSTSAEAAAPSPDVPSPQTSEDKAVEPTSAHAPAAADVSDQTEVAPAHALKSEQSKPAEASGMRGGGAATEDHSPTSPSSPATTDAHPPPLRTSSPTKNSEPQMASQQIKPDPSRGDNRSPSPKIAAAEPKSPIPTSASTEHSEILPTAPLNPRRATPEVTAATPPVSLDPISEPNPHPDASGSSPIKDSDTLSEEIMKSLSPIQPPETRTDGLEAATAAYRAVAAEPTRESSYLGDVYGDYWSTTEDKTDVVVPALPKPSEPEKALQEPNVPPAESRAEGPAVAAAPAGADAARLDSPPRSSSSTPTKAPEAEPTAAAKKEGDLRRRFSWEAALEGPVPAGLLVEQKVLGLGADNAASASTTPAATAAAEPADSESGKSAADLRAEAAPEVHHAAALAPAASPDRRQSPSPVPAPVSIDDSQGGGDNGGIGRRLSLAEEKIVFQASSSPVPATPPLEEHPAFAEPQSQPQQQPQQQQQQPSQQTRSDLPPAPSPVNILGFRNIMEMPSPAERIRQYGDTRRQFAVVDTGLDGWLRAMVDKHPELAQAVLEQEIGAAQAQAQGQGQGQGQGGRLLPATSSLHHMPGNLQQGLAQFGHNVASGQVGTKSKELMKAAGKAGKGLLSKGRNKLRERARGD